MTKLAIRLVGAILVVSLSQQVETAPTGGAIEVSLEVVANHVEGAPQRACRTAELVEKGKRKEWWVAILGAEPLPQGAPESAGRGIRCEVGSSPKEKDVPGVPTQRAYVVADLSTIAGSQPEGLMTLDVSLSVRKGPGLEMAGAPLHTSPTNKREYVCPGACEILIPILAADANEREALGIHEVFLRVGAGWVGKEPPAAYGRVWVASRMEGAEVLLDGGVVGTIEAGRAILPIVVAGVRDVRVRDATGRDARRLVRVISKRTVLVDLSLEGSAQEAFPYVLSPLGKNAQGHEEYRRERDGAVVVKVPGGEFLMGNRDTERQPLEHKVSVSEFLMDRTEVTWRQYKRFLAATGVPLPYPEPYWGIHDDHPVVFVSWEETSDYCDWVGGRLPTEAEWEKAARGTDGRKYPWGNEEPDPQRAVYRRSWGNPATDPAGAHPSGASPYGLMDMAGSVWEWCSDWYDDKYYESSPPKDPRGPATGQAHAVRGGSWDSRPDVLSCSCRGWGRRGYREGDFGFRCAMRPPR